MKTVTYSNGSLPPGYEVTVGHLDATLINGEAVEVSDEAVALYEKRTGKTFDDLLLGKAFGGPGRPKSEKLEGETTTGPFATATSTTTTPEKVVEVNPVTTGENADEENKS